MGIYQQCRICVLLTRGCASSRQYNRRQSLVDIRVEAGIAWPFPKFTSEHMLLSSAHHHTSEHLPHSKAHVVSARQSVLPNQDLSCHLTEELQWWNDHMRHASQLALPCPDWKPVVLVSRCPTEA